jgi:hypothetical protein
MVADLCTAAATMKTTLAFLFLAVVAIEAAVPNHGHNNRFLGKALLQLSYNL